MVLMSLKLRVSSVGAAQHGEREIKCYTASYPSRCGGARSSNQRLSEFLQQQRSRVQFRNELIVCGKRGVKDTTPPQLNAQPDPSAAVHTRPFSKEWINIVGRDDYFKI